MKYSGMKNWILTLLLVCIGIAYITAAANDGANVANAEPTTPEAEANSGNSSQAPVVEPSPEQQSTDSPGGAASPLLPTTLLVLTLATFLHMLL